MTYLTEFDDQQKAIDKAIWMNFKHRSKNYRFGVIDGPSDNYSVCDEATANDFETTFLDIILKDYSALTFEHIRQIRTDEYPLDHLEYIYGLFATADGNILQFLLHTKLPLEKIIRYELASRGYDQNNNWVGFDKSEEIWLKDN